MTPDSQTPDPQDPASDAGKTGPRRTRVAAVLVVVLVLLAPLAVYLYQHRPNLYDRTRTDLVEAGRELEIYGQDMVDLVETEHQGTRALKATIESLRDAAASDPDDLAEINAIASALRELEDPAHDGELSAAQLRRRYDALAARVQRLIEKRGVETQVQREAE
jgi:hypothetical protein